MKKVLKVSFIMFGVIFLAGCGKQSVSQSRLTVPTPEAQQPIANPSPVNQPNQTGDIVAMISGWKTYSDQKYGYQFQYPSSWNLVGDNGNDPNGYNITVWQGDGLDKDNIQLVKVRYTTNGDISDRESYLKLLTNNNYVKISIAGGQGYYIVEETKDGSSPTVYLVDDKEIFLMNFNIFDPKKTSLTDAEKLFKQVIDTFQFTN